ncbi:SIMPL domain-containing protein [Aquimarina sp. MMG015]|uniref:SIMPL domain-containing protein n=1 Tax=Aquimarina TaxID=290174 RepID=UPI0004053CD1|nr:MULTISPECIES: SIMPL domain-containing protein [Aquimarina]MBQ4801526.1 SIMPL domain-containing protein [Aquimarina sp. MMG015]
MNLIKKILIVFILCQGFLNAQQQNSISVIGEANKTNEINTYIVNVEFREVIGYKNRNNINIKSKTVSELEKEFAAALSKVNINFSRFEEDIMYRISSYDYTNSSFYFYKTTSLDEVKKIISQKIEGVTNTKVDIIAKEMTNEQIGKLTKEAVDDARKTADQIAINIGKKVGDVIQIENPNNKYKYYNAVAVKEPTKYYIKVVFSLE